MPAKHERKPTFPNLRLGRIAGICLLLGAVIFGIVELTSSGGKHAPGAPHGSAAVRPLDVVGITPVLGATGVGFNSTIAVRFSQPLASGSSLPSISPSIAGSWKAHGERELVFTPHEELPPEATIVVTVPAGSDGPRSSDGAELTSTVVSRFTVAVPPMLRLQELLAELNYLPYQFVPGQSAGASTLPATGATTNPPSGPATSGATGTSGTTGTEAPSTTLAPTVASPIGDEPTDPRAISLDAVAGSFMARFSNIPAQLAAAWQPGAWNLATKGAVMAFEYQNSLTVDGEPGPAFWSKLLEAVANRSMNARPYDYVIVTETYPETLYLWSEGSVIFQTAANTGVSGAATALGTFPVYLRYTSTTMTGKNPDGTHYSDPGVPWVSYFNGSDAVHGFIRAGYGYQQSDGCVELPIAAAAHVFPYDSYGTLVTVTTGELSAELGATPPSVIAPPPAPTTSTTSTSSTTTSTTLAPKRRHRTTTTTSAPTTTTAPGTTTTN